jgi:uncharacterized membrane protein YfcA
MVWLTYLLVGSLSGLLAGLFGIGGGLVIVPVLNYWFAWSSSPIPPDARMHFAIGTSLAVIIFTAVSSLRAHHRRGAVLWPAVVRLVPGVLLGGLAGAALADAMSNDLLQSVFGFFVVAIAIQMILNRRPEAGSSLPGAAGFALAGFVIGVVSALAGIGGGLLTVPFLLWCSVGMREAVGSAAACTFPVAMAGAAGFVISGWDTGGTVAGATGYVYWPAVLGIAIASVLTAPLGARLAHALPVARLRRAFAMLLVIVGLRMLLF